MKYNIAFLKVVLFSVSFQCMISGCNLINPDEPIPSLIEVHPVELQVQAGQGSDMHKITEVWVFANSNHIGVFAPPVTIPFLQTNEQTDFVFRAGIRNNGVLDDAVVYPMLTSFEATLNTLPGEVVDVHPVFRYRTEAVFSFLEDFEDSNELVEDRDGIAETMVMRSGTDAFEGMFSGEIILTAENDTFEVTHPIALIDLPFNQPSYLELDYKSDVAFGVGLLGIPLTGQSFPNFFIVIFPSEEWNKIYIELTDRIEESQLPAYKLLFKAFYPAGETRPELKIQLDNIKVVHL